MSEQPLTVNEIFFSIQGESRDAGRPCIFIRLAFCNLRCTWCDTPYSFYEGKEQSIDEVVTALANYPCRLVEVTGGEPLAQEACVPLLTRLCEEGYEVLLETSGSIDMRHVDPRVRKIMDLKCPGSGMADRNCWKNLEYLSDRDEVKFVILDRDDYVWAKDVIRDKKLDGLCGLLLSPVFEKQDPEELANWILEDGLDVRMQLQLHKFIWEPNRRGV